MGQAKLRGTFEQRKEAALKHKETLEIRAMEAPNRIIKRPSSKLMAAAMMASLSQASINRR